MNLNLGKLSLSVLAIAALATFFTACDLFDKVDDVNFPAEFETTTSVNESQDGTNVVYTNNVTISLEDNDEVKKYINKIKEIQVEEVTYRIAEYNADGDAVILTDASTTFQAGSSNVSVSYGANGVNLQLQEEEVPFDLKEDELEILATALKTEKELKIASTGTLSRTPVSFKVITKVKVKVTAEVLD